MGRLGYMTRMMEQAGYFRSEGGAEQLAEYNRAVDAGDRTAAVQAMQRMSTSVFGDPNEMRNIARNERTWNDTMSVLSRQTELRGGDVGTTLDSKHKSALKTNRINKSYERIDVPTE
jgi:hypothetical protein